MVHTGIIILHSKLPTVDLSGHWGTLRACHRTGKGGKLCPCLSDSTSHSMALTWTTVMVSQSNAFQMLSVMKDVHRVYIISEEHL